MPKHTKIKKQIHPKALNCALCGKSFKATYALKTHKAVCRGYPSSGVPAYAE